MGGKKWFSSASRPRIEEGEGKGNEVGEAAKWARTTAATGRKGHHVMISPSFLLSLSLSSPAPLALTYPRHSHPLSPRPSSPRSTRRGGKTDRGEGRSKGKENGSRPPPLFFSSFSLSKILPTIRLSLPSLAPLDLWWVKGGSTSFSCYFSPPLFRCSFFQTAFICLLPRRT
jgi:hypothetical protein